MGVGSGSSELLGYVPLFVEDISSATVSIESGKIMGREIHRVGEAIRMNVHVMLLAEKYRKWYTVPVPHTFDELIYLIYL